MLLQWCTLEPSGPSSLAALRFGSPVRIQKITIYPTNSEPFTQVSGVVSRTEPEAFFLQLFFNAHPIPHHGAKEKPKPSNSLIPTVIAYAGGHMDFAVNMSPEFATRLMIVKGGFESVSMAIYGDMVHEIPPPPTLYVAKPIPSFDPIPLAPALNTAHFKDPTQLASQLLNLIPDAPPLSLIITLMFCLKPSNDDWDLPEFPYLHPNLDECYMDFDLELADRLTMQPAAIDTKPETFERFATQIGQSIGPKDENQAYYIAGVLVHSASQLPEMARALLRNIDLSRVFDAFSMDVSTLQRLSDAASNVDIARELNTEPVLNVIRTVERDATLDAETRSVARQLLSRIEGVLLLEDAISNTQANFGRAAAALRDIAIQEQSFGIWLASMINHPDLVDKLSENAVVSSNSLPPPLLLCPRGSVSHDDFISFLRAFIGVGCVLAVYAWADSLPHQRCRERTLGILRLWISIDGYREILEHLLLLRQMIFRLECMLDSDIPTRSGIDAEHLLVILAKNPSAFLRHDLMQCILSLKPPHSYITEDERQSMRQAALISDDGLIGAIEELVREVERPPSFRSLRVLRVALAVVLCELKERGEYYVLEEFWNEGSCSLVTCLAEIFLAITEEVSTHFKVSSPSNASLELLTQLFRASDDVLKLLLHLAPTYLTASRVIRSLTTSTADLFACTDLADNLYSQSSPACIAAQETRQSCIDLVRTMSESPESIPGGKLAAEVILRTLLDHGLQSGEREPAHHLLQVFCLVDCLLPMPDASTDIIAWTQKVLPNVLQELWAFCRSLDTENKAHLVRRLVGLDKGVIGIGEWVIMQELTDLNQTLSALEQPDLPDQRKLIRQYQVSLSLQFLVDLLNSSSSVSASCLQYLFSDSDAAKVLSSCLQSFFQQDLVSPYLHKLIHALVDGAHHIPIDEDSLHFPIALSWLRGCRNPGIDCSTAAPFLYFARQSLECVPVSGVVLETLATEISGVIVALNEFDDEELEMDDLPVAITDMIEFYIRVFKTDSAKAKLYGFAPPSTVFQDFFRRFEGDIAEEGYVDSLVSGLDLAEDPLPPRIPIPLPDTPLSLSVQDLTSLLHLPSPPSPSTPRKAKAANQDVLSLVTFSPPTAVIRSSATTGLTKTYLNNDFRQLRSIPNARQNTSRLPSMHVDDFENATSSPTQTIAPLAPLAPLGGMPGTMTIGSPNIPTIPFAAATPDFLAPGFTQAFPGAMMPPPS